MRKLTPNTPEAQEMKPLFGEIIAAVKALNHALSEATVAAEVYKIDLYGIGEDSKPIVPDNICPSPVTGAEAIRLTQDAYTQFKRFENQHPNTSMRLPGIVFVNDLPWDLVQRVNDLKTQLHNLITDHYQPGSRAVITRQLFRGVSMLQVYRKINFVEEAPRKLVFTWAGNTTSIKTISQADAIEFIEATRSHKPARLMSHEWDEVINQEIQQIKNFAPAIEFRIKKPIAPHPRLMVYQGTSTDYDAMIHANLPVLVSTKESVVPEIVPLTSWTRGKRSKVRKGQMSITPVVERLHLYACE